MRPVWQAPVRASENRGIGYGGGEQFDAALRIVEKLRAEGYEAYLAGGCVRDLLLGREPADYDVATSATPEVVLEMFPRTFAVGAHFGVVLVATGGGADAAGAAGHIEAGEESTVSRLAVTEVATFRSDLAYSDGRHPDGVRYTKTAEEDVQRRDFTINGLLLDPLRRERDALLGRDAARMDAIEGGSESRSVLDYVGGLADLDAGVVRAIGRPELRFEEDHLRMLRGVRFAARFGFELEAETKRAIRSLASRIRAGEPRTRSRRADEDAYGGPCAAGI